MKRIFTACKIPIDASLMAFIELTQRCFAGSTIKWVETKNLHLTLVFYGDTDNHQLDNIKRHTNQMVANGKKFTLLTTNQGFFGTVSNPKVLWIGFKEPSGELAKIQQGLTKLAMAEGILLEAKPFKMHLTLGRVNRGVTENMMKAWLNAAHAMPQLSFFVDEISVFESILTPQGPIYKPLHVFKLP